MSFFSAWCGVHESPPPPPSRHPEQRKEKEETHKWAKSSGRDDVEAVKEALGVAETMPWRRRQQPVGEERAGDDSCSWSRRGEAHKRPQLALDLVHFDLFALPGGLAMLVQASIR